MNIHHEEDNLIMFLPSYLNMSEYTDNKISDFVVQLPKTIVFKRSMECAINEIILPKSYYYLKNQYMHIVFSYERFYPKPHEWNFDEKRLYSVKVSDGSLKNYSDLCERVSNVYESIKTDLETNWTTKLNFDSI